VTLITANDTLFVDIENSDIDWIGRKVAGEHTGTLNLAEGWVIMQEDSIIGGKFIFDITSIQNTDIESLEWKEKLEKHLMAEDFFFVDSFPHAILEIKNHRQTIDDKSENIDQIIADLTIRGITHEISFPLQISQIKSVHNAEGIIEIDRTLFNIHYKSGTFFEDLGDRMIYDDFTVKFSLQTMATKINKP
jgi:polyisoprenoid-binding protein YceI